MKVIKEPETNEYLQDLEIDQDALDFEWINQPKLYFQYAEKAAIARFEMDTAKSNAEIIKAELDAAIRRTAQEGGLKLTEAKIAAAVSLEPELQKVIQDHHKACFAYNLMSEAVRALDHRKRALENLVTLWVGSYFSSPKEKQKEEGEPGIQEKLTHAVRRSQRESLNKRRTK